MSLALVGCSGGGGGSESSASAAPTVISSPNAVAVPTLVTVPQYKQLRASIGTGAVTTVPDAASMAALVADNHHMAVAQLYASLADGNNNQAVVPPLTYAALRTLGAAASGDSLTQISSHFDLAPTPYVAAQQTGRVVSQWWADHGQYFRTEFLTTTDALGPWPRLAAWSAAETGFSDGSATSDAALMQSLSDASLSMGWFVTPTSIRMLVTHSLTANAGWGAVTPFDGIFERGYHDMVRLPLLRLTAGVTRYSGTDFTADMVSAGDLRVMTLRPSAATLSAFAAARLEPALAEAVQALIDSTTSSAVGEMLLPQVDITLQLQADGPLRHAGVTQVYDEVYADLKGLDGLGGTYVQTASPMATLHIAADGLKMQAAHAMAFTFSPRNLNSSMSAGFVLVDGFGYVPQACVWPTPDLRSFFLVILDARHWVVSITAIQAPPGIPVTPTCTG